MAVLTVGAGRQFATFSAAVARSRDGDTIELQAGTYTDDGATITKKLTIRGVGGMAKLVATKDIPNGKAILVTEADVTLENIAFSGARVPAGNGAGIRYQGGHLVVRDCLFAGNQNGLLAAPDAGGSITIERSEFDRNGTGDGRTHNLYVNQVGTLTVRGSYFHGAVVGHEIKSRAYATLIEGNRIANGPEGTASYNIDLPDGGRAIVRGNVIEEGPRSSNPHMIHFGGEGTPHAGSSLLVSGNTFIDHRASATAVLNQTGVGVTVSNNRVYGLTADRLLAGAGGVSGTVFLARDPGLDTTAPWSVSGAASGAASGSVSQSASAAVPGNAPGNAPEGDLEGDPPAPDVLVVRISADVAGAMSFVAGLDGRPLGAPVAVARAADGSGEQVVTFAGDFGDGPHVASIAVAGTAPGGRHAATLTGVSFDGEEALSAPVALRPGTTGLVAVNAATDLVLAVPTGSVPALLPTLQAMLA